MKATIKPEDFAGVFRAALAFTGKDDMLPVLRHVHVMASHGEIVAEATNRFVAGRDTAPLSDTMEGETADVLVSADDAKRLVSWADKERIAFPIVFEDDRLVAGWRGEMVAVFGGDMSFPKLAPLMDMTPGDGVQHVAIDPSNLELFKRANLARKGERRLKLPVRFTFGKTDTRIVRVEFSDHFVGILMPMRYEWDQS